MATNALASPPDEPEYLGKKLSYWVNVIHDHDDEMISLGLDAVRTIGPAAKAAVPDLIALVSAPFVPIRVGKDSNTVIATKLYDIEIRAGAVDALTSIGESAAPASWPLVLWAVTTRVVPQMIGNADDEELYIELVMMDTEQRMRIAGAISKFGAAGSPAIARMLSSSDSEKRKLGVAILNEDALPIAAELLRSQHCEDRDLGLFILRDMDIVVPKSHLDWLQQRIVCEAN
jgi:hypothetical protein